MDNWPLVAVRWATYADIGLLFGAPLFALLFRVTRPTPLSRRTLAFLAIAGIGLSISGFALILANMAGSQVAELDRQSIIFGLSGMALGWALIARLTALVLVVVVIAGSSLQRRTPTVVLTAFSAIAVGTLAWSGHAAATEGMAGLGNLAVDIAHLLAGSAWIGALVVLLKQVWEKDEDASRTGQILTHFGNVGSVIVALLVLTGIANLGFLAQTTDLLTMASNPYGQLLLIKLALFVVMLLLAALNRFVLTPSLVRQSGSQTGAMRHLRQSIGLELGMIAIILALVALLGTLDPSGAI